MPIVPLLFLYHKKTNEEMSLKMLIVTKDVKGELLSIYATRVAKFTGCRIVLAGTTVVQ